MKGNNIVSWSCINITCRVWLDTQFCRQIPDLHKIGGPKWSLIEYIKTLPQKMSKNQAILWENCYKQVGLILEWFPRIIDKNTNLLYGVGILKSKENNMDRVQWLEDFSSPQSFRKALIERPNCVRGVSEKERQRLIKLSDEKLKGEMDKHLHLSAFFL